MSKTMTKLHEELLGVSTYADENRNRVRFSQIIHSEN